MTKQNRRSIYISRITISLIALFVIIGNTNAALPKKIAIQKRDSIPLMNGFAVSFDVVGAAMMQLGSYGQYEGGLRLNMRNKYFPTVELGYGKADETDITTNIHYTTKAPYMRIGMDFNLLKDKRSSNHFFIGFRYAYTSYKDNVSLPEFKDPVWGNNVNYSCLDNKCYYHWVEAVVGIDAKIYGPLHLGWSLRYRKRIAYDEGILGKSWYVPGFGKSSNSSLGGTFNITFDI